MTRAVILAGLMLAAGTAQANSLDLSFNDDTARIGGSFTASDVVQVQANWLHTQEVGEVASLGVFQVGFASGGRQPIEAGLGAKAVFTDADDLAGGGDGGAVALGAFGRWVVPEADRVAVGGELFLAPGVLSFSGQDGYREAHVYGSYDLFKNTWVYLGYRYVKAEYEDRRNTVFDDRIHIGFRMNF